MTQQVVAIQNGDSAINVKYQYKDVYSLDIGENAEICMNVHSLCKILTALHLWTDIMDGETNSKINNHDYDLGEGTMSNTFHEKIPKEQSNKRKMPYEKKPVATVAKADDDDDFGALFNKWTNPMEKFRVKLQKK